MEKSPSHWADGVHDEDGRDDDYGMRRQQGVEALKEAVYGLVCHNNIWKAWDDVTSVEFNVGDVGAAKDLEIQCFDRLRVYDRVDRSEIKRTGGKLIGIRWVGVNKCDSTDADCGSRHVGREFNVG